MRVTFGSLMCVYPAVLCRLWQVGVWQRMWYGNNRHRSEDLSAQYGNTGLVRYDMIHRVLRCN